jgi:phage recombination protein Bet
VTSTVAVRQAGALSITGDQSSFTEAQLEAFGINKATRGEQLVFLHTAQRTGLDPAARQIYMIGRWDGREQREKFTIQTGIDGFRLIARRAADLAGQSISYEDTQWCGQDGVWRDVWLEAGHPAAARTAVLRGGERFPAVATYREYVQTVKSGDPNQMWSRMPANQLAKCAEGLALRKAFPQELANIYTDDEMGQADEPQQQIRPRAERSAFAKPATVAVAVVEESGELIDPLGDQMKALHDAFREWGLTGAADCLAFASSTIGRPVTATSQLTVTEAGAVINALATNAQAAWVTVNDTEGANP